MSNHTCIKTEDGQQFEVHWLGEAQDLALPPLDTLPVRSLRVLLKEARESIIYHAGMQRTDTPHGARLQSLLDRIDSALAGATSASALPANVPGNRVYLAGPMTGIAEYNFPAFNAAAERLRGFGLDVVNPAGHGIVEGATWSDYMRWDLAQLAACHSVYVLPGWEKSKGASLEVKVAHALGMLVFTVDGAPVAAPAAGDPQEECRYQWLITVAQMKALAAELIRAAECMGGDDEESAEIELILSAAKPGTVQDDDGESNTAPVLTVHLAEYPEEGVYPIDPHDPQGGRVDTQQAEGGAA